MIGPSQKNHNAFYIPQIETFNTNMGPWHCFPLTTYIQLKPKLLGKGYGTNCDAILKNVLDANFGVHFASLHCLSKTFIPNFVHHYFWPKSLQELGYLL